MKGKKNFVEIISILVGVVSLGFVIYQIGNVALQIGYVITLVLSAIVFFVYTNYNKISFLVKENKKLNLEMKQFKEKLNIYDRLNKIENKIFKEGE